MSQALSRSTKASPRQSLWPRYPSLYEINTWIWLGELAERYARQIDLSSVPEAEWDSIANCGFDAVWLMGVWTRSPAGIGIANRNESLLQDFRRALPEFRAADNVGSPYCVRAYVVDPNLGGPNGLAAARRQLAKRGMKLMLDFVPNHVAPDHPWVTAHPEYFVRGNRDEPNSCIELQGTAYACGRDPYFAPWPDVLQLNAFEPRLRQAVIETLSGIGDQCDGLRCDMAMLFLNSVFERTWGGRVGARPQTEYWVDVISAIKARYPGFLFVAEAYWDLEWDLQQLGFDCCYDKKLYDRLEHGSSESIRLHLCADIAYQGKLLRFIENHDEPRAASTFSPVKERAAALAVATLPGVRLFHEGQLEGRKVRPPVFLGRRPQESPDPELRDFYNRLLNSIRNPAFHEGKWTLCERTGWPDNTSFQDLLAWSWLYEHERFLIVVNLSDHPVQARVQLPWSDLTGASWRLSDKLSGAVYERGGDDMRSLGLYVELKPWNFHFLECVRITARSSREAIKDPMMSSAG